MNIITPAENPKDAARNLGENFLEKRTMPLPMDVDSPAMRVSDSASQKLPSIKSFVF
jgi:hypothetical protein